MSTASRLPFERNLTDSASHPVMVGRDGELLLAAIRAEVRLLVTWQWPAARALARVFQKVRLQRRWALVAAAERAGAQRRREEAEAILTAAAMRHARRLNFDLAVLTQQRSRLSFGSAAHNHDAAHMRAVYDRAISIASEHAAAMAQAAE